MLMGGGRRSRKGGPTFIEFPAVIGAPGGTIRMANMLQDLLCCGRFGAIISIQSPHSSFPALVARRRIRALVPSLHCTHLRLLLATGSQVAHGAQQPGS
jgi:hypothetical protein